MDQHNIKLTDVDRGRLGTLLTCQTAAAYGNARSRADLETRVEEAEVISVATTPRTLVTMNSTVEIADAKILGERRRKRFLSRPAGEHKRAVDVEKANVHERASVGGLESRAKISVDFSTQILTKRS